MSCYVVFRRIIVVIVLCFTRKNSTLVVAAIEALEVPFSRGHLKMHINGGPSKLRE